MANRHAVEPQHEAAPVALRPSGMGWVVRLDSGHQMVFPTTDLELLSS